MEGDRGIKRYDFKLSNISCVSCVKKIESALIRLPDIQQASVNFAEHTLSVNGYMQAREIIDQLAKLGYKAVLQESETPNGDAKSGYLPLGFKVLIPGLIGLFIMIYGMSGSAQINMQSLNGFWLTMSGITIVIMLYSGAHIYKAAYKSFLQHYATMDTLIAIGTLAAWVYSVIIIVAPTLVPENARHIYLEAALMIIALVNLGALLEAKARGKTSQAIKHLIGLRPKTARRLNKNNQEEKVPIEALTVGDLLQVRPGEKIALDGMITQGETNIDESMLTGEPLAVTKAKDDPVFSGTINKNGSFVYRVQKQAKDTVLSQIIALVENAQNSKPSIAKLADVVSAYFVPAVMLLAILTAVIWFNLGFSVGFVLVASITVLVIACPCALGLATPISVIVGTGKAAQVGVLIKNGEAMQQASKIDHIVLDKTGTITKGTPDVVGVECLESLNAEGVLQIAFSLEHYSEHPLAEAVINKAKQMGLSRLEVESFVSHTGLGVSGVINGKTIAIGSDKMISNDAFINLNALEKLALKRRGEGQTIMYVIIEKKVVAIIAVADPIKADAQAAISKLLAMNIKITMATGDHQSTADAIANQLGITSVIAGVMPKGKANYVQSLQEHNKVVVMVGDGINDAPALTQADIGFAIGNGTDVAIESADVTLMRSSLMGVVDAIIISKGTMKNIKQNLFGAFIYNGLGIPIAAGVLFPLFGVLLSPIIAGAAMAASSLTVIMNANRLRFLKLGERI